MAVPEGHSANELMQRILDVIEPTLRDEVEWRVDRDGDIRADWPEDPPVSA